MRIFGKEELRNALELISADGFCADIAELAYSQIHTLSPPTEISTLDYSINHRVVRTPSNDTKGKWKLSLTPYLAEPMNALDDPKVRGVVVPKPARSGGTVVAENYALKMMEFGPMGDIMWYLAGPVEVSSYADRDFKNIFEDHKGVRDKIGNGKNDDKIKLKKVAGRTVELMAMGAKTTTNRQGSFIVFDEPDSYNVKFASNFMDQGRQRQRMLGSAAKIYACSHPDIGWSGGISQAWVQSSRGIFIMACAECGDHASPYPTKHWPDIPRFKLHYSKCPERKPLGERLRKAQDTAAMLCPSCGALLDDEQRSAMIDEGSYMHEGQTLDIKAGVIGDADSNETMGFWVHVLMVKQVGLDALARDLEGALEHFERTGKTDKLKQVLVRTFGEAFEGAGEITGLSAASLRKRVNELAQAEENERPVDYRMGEVPDGVMFLTAAIDTGGKKFDVLIKGWDLQRRSWLIDRFTIRQREHSDGVMRDIRPDKVQEDWMVLESQVIDRLIPFQSDPSKAMPIAITVIDSGDGKSTWKAYEFARRMDRKRWGNWRKVRCIKGATSPNAPDLPPTPKNISRDNEGKAIEPVVTLHMLGVNKLKDDVVERLAVEDGSPGQCYFAVNTPKSAFEEFFGEFKDEGKWTRPNNAPNETLDLYGYAEAARLMLEPDRKSRNWEEGSRPIWATPISLQPKGGDQEAVAGENIPKPESKPKKSIIDRFNDLNS